VAQPVPREGIIVLGAPRSGTTLLRRLLDAHPNIACPGETNVFRACGRFLRSDRLADGVAVGVVDGLGYAGFTPDEVLARLRDLAFAFHRDYAAKQGKRRWASKSALDTFYIDEIEALCGDQALFVCIQRHALDVACSMQDLSNRTGRYMREMHDYIARYPMILEAFAHAWVDLARAVRAFVQRHPDNAVLVNYEDLAANADVTMERIMAFVGEEWRPELLQQAMARRDNIGIGDWKTYARSAVDEASVGRWKKLPPYTIGRLAAICNPMLEACGYEPVAVEEERSSDETRRRHEVGVLLQGLASKRGGTPGQGG
jgi:hypothetical protein